MAGFDEWRRAKIDVADVRKNADGRNQSRAHQTHCDDLQVRPAISAVYGMVHYSLPSFVDHTLRRPTGRLHYALVNA
jgi:hypothetical protein